MPRVRTSSAIAPAYARHERRVERCGERNRLRKHGRARANETVDRLVERDDWNAEGCRVDEVALNRVHARRVGARIGRGPCSVANSDLKPERAVRIVVRCVPIAGQHEELPEFVVDRHAADQVVDAIGDGKALVAVGRRVLRRDGGTAGECDQGDDEREAHYASSATSAKKPRMSTTSGSVAPIGCQTARASASSARSSAGCQISNVSASPSTTQ